MCKCSFISGAFAVFLLLLIITIEDFSKYILILTLSFPTQGSLCIAYILNECDVVTFFLQKLLIHLITYRGERIKHIFL